MARLARFVVPGYPHHVTQRGIRKLQTFFNTDDYRVYLKLISQTKDDAGVVIWAYCLMPNHVHIVLVPRAADSLARLFRLAHRQYTRHINFRYGWRGHLWQERFHSVVMDERHLIAAVRYTELNPVKAALCERPQDWPWSSVHAHLDGHDDQVVTVQPMLDLVGNWQGYLDSSDDAESIDIIRSHTKTGRPVGEDHFLKDLEKRTGRRIRRKKPGRKPRG